MNKKGLTISMIFQAESANYGSGYSNLSVLKKMMRGDLKEYSYISRQAIRYNIIKELEWDNTPVEAMGSANATVVQFAPTATIKDYPEIETQEVIVDNMCMQLVIRPETFDVLVAPNLYGDIVSDLCAGLVGGLGFAPSGNIGDEYQIYEAVHGSAPDIAGKGIANPSALLLAFALMLEALGKLEEANKLRDALAAVVADKKVITPDIGGKVTTEQFTAAIIEKLR